MDKRTYFLAVTIENGIYCGSFLDFDCVVDQGDSLDELISNAKELLNFTVQDMVESGERLPDASDGVRAKEKAGKDILCLVPVTVYPPAKTERINITAAGNLLNEITDYARKNHISRSELMVKSTIDYIRLNA